MSKATSHIAEQIVRNGLLALSKTVDAEEYFTKIKDYVLEHRNEEINLKGGYKWILGPFEDTIYKDDKDIVEQWEQFYLPDYMRMQVLGQFCLSSCNPNNPQMVLMICEDNQIYVYGEQRLHLVAKDLKEAINERITFPSKTAFHYGQSFEDLTDEELDKMRASEETKEAKERYKDEVWGEKVLESLKNVQKRRVLYHTADPPKRTMKSGTGTKRFCRSEQTGMTTQADLLTPG